MQEATELALRALRHRDRSRRELDRRLEQAGVSADERELTLDSLETSGLLSEDRFAAERARGLAARNGSDRLIRSDLAQHGIANEVVSEVLERLEPESERAARIFQRRGGGERSLRYLSGKGFARESLEFLADADPVH